MAYIVPMERARYKFSSEKAFAAIHWMSQQGTNVDIHAAMKACYFADKTHLNEHFQPIFGANYRAMKYGPVPVEIYEIMKGDGLWLWEVSAERTPWQLDGYTLRPDANSAPDMAVFSESELQHLKEGFGKSTGMTFTARTAATHGHDWQTADGGFMRYEDMVEPSEQQENIVKWVQETASHIRL